MDTLSHLWRVGNREWQTLPSLIRCVNLFWVSEKASDMAWHQAKSDPEGVAASVTPAEAESSKDLDEGCAGDAVASGKLLRIKSIMALTGAGIDVSSASLSSREGEEGWVGEDRDRGLSIEASQDEARDECCRRGEEESLDSKRCRLGEGESPEANPIRFGEEAKPLERGNPLRRVALEKGNPLKVASYCG